MDEKILKKISVLKKIAEKFNEANIKWNVGASILLYFKGITDKFNDLDIMVSEQDIDKVKNIFVEFNATLKESVYNEMFDSKGFFEYVIEDVEVDIMAGLGIINNGIKYYFPIENEEASESITIDDIVINLGSLKDWERYYDLMKRPQKAELIRNYLEK